MSWDGYPNGIDKAVIHAKTEGEYLAALENFLKARDDVSRPTDGWPWPWNDSRTTDYAYTFRNGGVYAWSFGHGPFPAWEDQPEEDDGEKDDSFPDMTHAKAVTMGKRRGSVAV